MKTNMKFIAIPAIPLTFANKMCYMLSYNKNQISSKKNLQFYTTT